MLGYFLDDKGFIDHVDFVNEKTTGNYITVSVPTGLNKPQWNGTQWIEGLSNDELNEIHKTEIKPSEVQKQLSAMNTQIAQLTQSNAALTNLVTAQNQMITKMKGGN